MLCPLLSYGDEISHGGGLVQIMSGEYARIDCKRSLHSCFHLRSIGGISQAVPLLLLSLSRKPYRADTSKKGILSDFSKLSSLFA